MSPTAPDAIEKLESKISSNPHLRAFSRLADAYRKGGNIQQAIDLCIQGLGYHPAYVTGRIILGRCYLEQENYSGAIDEFTKVCQIDRRNHVAIKMLADTFARQSMNEKAGDLYAILLRMDPFNQSLVNLTAQMPGTGKADLFDIIGLSYSDSSFTVSQNTTTVTQRFDNQSFMQPHSMQDDIEILNPISDDQGLPDQNGYSVDETLDDITGSIDSNLSGNDIDRRMSMMFQDEGAEESNQSGGFFDEINSRQEVQAPEELMRRDPDAIELTSSSIAPAPAEEISGSDISSRIDELFRDDAIKVPAIDDSGMHNPPYTPDFSKIIKENIDQEPDPQFPDRLDFGVKSNNENEQFFAADTISDSSDAPFTFGTDENDDSANSNMLFQSQEKDSPYPTLPGNIITRGADVADLSGSQELEETMQLDRGMLQRYVEQSEQNDQDPNELSDTSETSSFEIIPPQLYPSFVNEIKDEDERTGAPKEPLANDNSFSSQFSNVIDMSKDFGNASRQDDLILDISETEKPDSDEKSFQLSGELSFAGNDLIDTSDSDSSIISRNDIISDADEDSSRETGPMLIESADEIPNPLDILPTDNLIDSGEELISSNEDMNYTGGPKVFTIDEEVEEIRGNDSLIDESLHDGVTGIESELENFLLDNQAPGAGNNRPSATGSFDTNYTGRTPDQSSISDMDILVSRPVNQDQVSGDDIVSKLEDLFGNDSIPAMSIPDDTDEPLESAPQGFYSLNGESALDSSNETSELLDKLEDEGGELEQEFDLNSMSTEEEITDVKENDLVDEVINSSVEEIIPLGRATSMNDSDEAWTPTGDVEELTSTPTISGADVKERLDEFFPDDVLNAVVNVGSIPDDDEDNDVKGNSGMQGFYNLSGDSAVETAEFEVPLGIQNIELEGPLTSFEDEETTKKQEPPAEPRTARDDLLAVIDDNEDPLPSKFFEAETDNEGTDILQDVKDAAEIDSRDKLYSIPDHVLTPTLADIYFQQGQPHLSVQIYSRLLAKDPDDDKLRKRLMQVKKAITDGNAPAPAAGSQTVPPAPKTDTKKTKPKSTPSTKKKREAEDARPLAGVRLKKKLKDTGRKKI